MRTLVSLAVVTALGAVGWTLGEQYSPSDPEVGQRLGAFTGVVFGLLIFLAVKARE